MLAADSAPVSTPGAHAAPEAPDSDPLGDLALERADALPRVAVVVEAVAADGVEGKKGDEENIDKSMVSHFIHVKDFNKSKR